MKKLAWSLIASLALWQTTRAAAPSWLTNLETALAQAKADNKMVFLDFTGSNWCITCKVLHKNVLTSREFVDFAKDNLVLVLVDFPQPNRLPAEQQKANDALARKYDIEGYPTLVVLDSAGQQLSKFGYDGQSAKEFVAELKKLKKPSKSSTKSF
jgi:thiol:disulfide interchange protein